MRSRIHLVALAIVLSTAAFGTGRFSGEKGARARYRRLATGFSHTCAILDDGTVQCWGYNAYGQLGAGDQANRNAPVTVSNLGPAVSVAAGASHTCAILSNSGVVRCWGVGFALGNGSTTGLSTVPVAVSGLTNVVALAAGAQHNCAIRVDGTVWCWGVNTHGQLGNNSVAPAYVPVQVSNLLGAVSVSAGDSHTCAALANGTVKCWGDNSEHQLGNGSSVTFSAVPVTASTSGASDISAGRRFTCATPSGSVVCWGYNGSGQFGIGSTAAVTTPIVAHLPNAFEAAIATGGSHTCIILAGGAVQCWGLNALGQLGDGTTTDHYAPGPVVSTVTNAIEIAAGNLHTCATIVDGTIRCWGDNTYGQLGNGTFSQVGIVSVSGIVGSFLGRGVTAGNQFTCARRGTGASACWGAGVQGQLGDSANVSSTSAAAVTGLTNPASFSAGNGAHACVANTKGGVECWGDNSRGQLGTGNFTPANQPTPILFGGPYAGVTTGDLHTCAVTVTGIIACWGAGDRGQLGTGGTTDSPFPQQINPIRNVVAIAAGNKFNCALISDGTVICWGDNTFNQLGDGGAEPFATTPKTVPGLVNMVSITAGANHACAVSAFGTVLCWGANSRGQIGNNSTLPASFPTTVQGLTDAISVSAGSDYTCAVQAGGTASCWGANDSGQLAASDSLDHLTPTPVIARLFFFHLYPPTVTYISLSGITQISTATNPALPNQEHTCALLSTGVVECWGNNSQGQIGDGTTTNQTRPVPVNSFLANVDPAATLRNQRVAEVTALIDCDAGDQAHITLTLVQGAVSGAGQAEARCSGRLLRVPMTVPAQGPSGFQSGAATAKVEAIVRNGDTIVADTHWTKQVVLAPPAHPGDH